MNKIAALFVALVLLCSDAVAESFVICANKKSGAVSVKRACSKKEEKIKQLASLMGPAGPAGATGAQGTLGQAGANGAAGETGLQGPMGATGPQGDDGALRLYGDGHSGDLNYTFNSNWYYATGEALRQNMQTTSFAVASGVTLTVPSGTTIRSTGACTIDGTITVMPYAKGGIIRSFSPATAYALVGHSPSPGLSFIAAENGQVCPNTVQCRGGYPGKTAEGDAALKESEASAILNPGPLGGGGGGGSLGYEGGDGGGTLRLICNGQITIGESGLMEANGGSSAGGGGGGAGGIIILASGTGILVNGTLSARGGEGGIGNVTTGPGGGGGGGIVHLISRHLDYGGTGEVNVLRGICGAHVGVTQNPRSGGGAGGNLAGDGGNGGSVNADGSEVFPASFGNSGYWLQTGEDPLALFF